MNKFRIVLILLVVLVSSLGLHLLVYGFNFTYESISNCMFIFGIIMFLSSVVVLSGSYEIFHGIRYSLQALYRKGFRSQYPTFLEYKTEKSVKYKTSIYLEIIIISIIILVVAVFLASKVV
ncbi:MAG: DUF3899 domain-containing protein [Candidatus Izimaplasma sp.]|nr:DUF3899 domain-containing protein [Candidatus Izimaplasma bacterium]